ncbi:MAG TPA: DUF177 domain-containing protein [Enterovirga sp.]|jgi:uncharacterized metal-binding protein YceD (DUF177 family)
MTPDSVGPLSRPVVVARLPPGGMEVDILATPEECAALAADLKLPEVKSLNARFRLSGKPERVHVTGRITAEIVQICVVTLEPFESRLDEDVEVDFEEPRPDERADPRSDLDLAEEGPDEIVDGRIDVGALAAEFLALGLDPYPRKPGVDFNYEERDLGDNPFARLAELKPDKG